MLVLTRRPGESLLIGEDIEVKIIESAPDRVKLGITAPNDVRVLREDLQQTIHDNRQAAAPAAPNLKDLLHKL